MGPRFAIVAGLLVGVGVAVILLIGLLALAPEPSSPATPAPSVGVHRSVRLGAAGETGVARAVAGLNGILPGVDVTP
jgi:hypothetical protein